jgi:hypothetical protein
MPASKTDTPDEIPAYDFLDDTMLKHLNTAVKRAAGGSKSEMIVKDFAPVESVFIHTDRGQRCSICGTLQEGDVDSITACQQCGAAFRVMLIVGY